MKTPLGLYLYPIAAIAALAALCVSLWAGLWQRIPANDCLLYVLLSLLVGWLAACRFDRLERRMGDAE